MLCEKDTTIFKMSENSSLAEMKVDLMITVIRAEIKFMNLLLEDSKSIDFNILSHELGVLNGLAGTGSDEISTIICDFNIQNNKMFVNMREKKESINEILRLQKSMTSSSDKNTYALELNEILKQHELEIIKLNGRYNTLNNQLKDTERLRDMKEEKENGEKGQFLAFQFEERTATCIFFNCDISVITYVRSALFVSLRVIFSSPFHSYPTFLSPLLSLPLIHVLFLGQSFLFYTKLLPLLFIFIFPFTILHDHFTVYFPVSPS